MDVCKYTGIIIWIKMYRIQRCIIMSGIPPLVDIVGIRKNRFLYKYRINRTSYFISSLFHSAMIPCIVRVKVMAVVWHVIDDVPDDDLRCREISVLLSCSFVICIDYSTKQVVLIIGHTKITIRYRRIRISSSVGTTITCTKCTIGLSVISSCAKSEHITMAHGLTKGINSTKFFNRHSGNTSTGQRRRSTGRPSVIKIHQIYVSILICSGCKGFS